MAPRAHALRRLRRSLGLTPHEMAEALQVSRQHVYQIEARYRAMGLPTARRVLKRFPRECRELGIGVEELVA